MRIPARGPGRPRKWNSLLVQWRADIPQEDYELAEEERLKLGLSRAEWFHWMLRHVKLDVMELIAKVKHQEEYIKQLEKENQALLEEHEKLLARIEKLEPENQALKEENKELKQRIRELERQLRMSARERRADDLKKEIHEVLAKYGEGIKLVDLLKRLGYSGELMKHAREFLEQWFVKEGRIYVSYELGLVIIPHHKFGELAWVVKLNDSFRSTVLNEFPSSPKNHQ